MSSLRKPTRLTPRRLAAARSSAQRSTGPRTPAGKERMRMNALKHGGDAAPENHAAVMRALGEDPAQYDALKGELMLSYGAGDPLQDQQLEDLAQLYWRRRRLERIETGLMRSALEEVEERQRQRALDLADVTFDASCLQATRVDLGESDDPCVQLRLLLSLLGVLCEQAKRQIFNGHQQALLEAYHPGRLGWRWGRFRQLLRTFVERAQAEEKHDKRALKEFLADYFPGGKEQLEADYQELLRLYEEEIAAVGEELEHQLQVQARRDALERDTCLAPEGETWERLLRQEASLDRSIDRKVRIILAMRREKADPRAGGGDTRCRHGSRTAPKRATASPPGEAAELSPTDGAYVPAPSADRSAPLENRDADLPKSGTSAPAAASSPEVEWNARVGEELSRALGLRAGTESRAQDQTPQSSKSPEQSQNVIENKAPAAPEVHA